MGQKMSFNDDPFGSNKTIDIPSDELPWWGVRIWVREWDFLKK
jgi:hypothetical protein